MLRTVAVIAQAPLAPFEFGVLCEVFGVDRTDDGVPAFDFTVCTEHPDIPVAHIAGATLRIDRGLDACDGADLVALPSGPMHTLPSPAVIEQVQAAQARGAYLLSVCTGAFTLAAAGVLSGRRCSTHWRYAEQLRDEHRDVEVDAEALYTHDDTIITSAGTAAGIDACLHLVRHEHGSEVAARIARRMVVAPHRDGGQQQFVERPAVAAPQDASLAGLLDWLVQHLEAEHSVADMADRVHLSARTFARRFRAETGSTPHTWLTQQRVLAAQGLLESSDLPLDAVAERVGLTSGALLRHHFTQTVGITPSTYRRRFAGAS